MIFYIRKSHLIFLLGTKGCLERLGLEYVDLIFAHRPDRATPMEETVRAFTYLINNGMAMYWGTSEWSAAELAVFPLSLFQL